MNVYLAINSVLDKTLNIYLKLHNKPRDHKKYVKLNLIKMQTRELSKAIKIDSVINEEINGVLII